MTEKRDHGDDHGHDHGDGHGHDDGHGHGHGHDDGHGHGHGHDDGHGHGHGHDDGHGHAQEHGHDDGHGHGHGSGHGGGPASGRAAARRSSGRPGAPSHVAEDAVEAGEGGLSLTALLGGIAVVAALTLLLLPFFFAITRLELFATVPQDAYPRFLLHLLSLPGGAVPGPPYGYQGLAVLAAVPFFSGLPPWPLANAPAGMAPDLLHAKVALAALSYLSLTATLYVTYRLARDRAGQSPGTAAFAAALLFALTWYTAFATLDPLAILLITLGLYLLPHRQGFTLLLLATPVINVQIAIVFALWLSVRCATGQADRDTLGLQWATSIAALLIYAALIAAVPLPGGAHGLDPEVYVATLRSSLASQTAVRALLPGLLPLLLLVVLGLVGHFGWPRRDGPRPRWDGAFRRVDLLIIPAMLVMAMAQFFEPGRIVMHAAPLFVVPVAAVLLHRFGASPAALAASAGHASAGHASAGHASAGHAPAGHAPAGHGLAGQAQH